MGFDVAAGDVLFLYDADGGRLLDAVRVAGVGRARDEGIGAWRVPTEPTPGADNRIDRTDAIVIDQEKKASLDDVWEPGEACNLSGEEALSYWPAENVTGYEADPR